MQTVEDVLAGMVRAWNAGSGAEYAKCCEEDADFVNIYGMHARGRAEIAAGHDFIFRTVYAGSRLEATVSAVRMLAENIALVHANARLEVPQGPMAGVMNSVPFMVMRRGIDGWAVTAFQNTLVRQPPVSS